MTIHQLYEQLNQLGIPEDWYYLHGLYGSTNDNDKIALLIKQHGYEVYVKERGEKNSEKRFSVENEACAYVLMCLKSELILHRASTSHISDDMSINERLDASNLTMIFEDAKKK